MLISHYAAQSRKIDFIYPLLFARVFIMFRSNNVHTIAILWFAVKLTGKILGRFIKTIPIEFANFKANLLRKFSLILSLSLSLSLSLCFTSTKTRVRARRSMSDHPSKNARICARQWAFNIISTMRKASQAAYASTDNRYS